MTLTRDEASLDKFKWNVGKNKLKKIKLATLSKY